MLDFLRSKKQMTSDNNLNKSILKADYTVIDTELTGLNIKKDSIISIGAIKMNGTKIHLDKTFYKLANPESKLKPESVVVHGITPSDVAKERNIDEIIKEFIEFCGKDILVGYCVSIDISFINQELKRLAANPIKNYIIDILYLYEHLKKNLTSNRCFSISTHSTSLYEIAKCFEIPLYNSHNALFDAYITAQLFQRFLTAINKCGVQEIKHLLNISSPEKGGDLFKIQGEITNF
jgi:DNA polymerase-3 subunit epsilon